MKPNPGSWGHGFKEFEAAKEETKNLLRGHGAEEPMLPTSSAVLSQVVARMTVNLIEILTNAMGIRSRDHQIAAKSSAQFFCRWNLHPTVSSIKAGPNNTIQQDITDFRLAQMRKSGHDINNPEESQTKHSGSAGTTPPDDSAPLQNLEIGLPKAQESEKANKYGGLMPSERSEDCSYYLHRLAELQQRLFDVNRCLYYLDDHPDDISNTINDLVAKATRQESPKYS